MSDRDRYVPTPEELEEGKLKKRKRDEGRKEGEPEDAGRIRTFLHRRIGVGRRRRYEEVESKPVPPRTRSTNPQAGDPQAREESVGSEPQGTRVRSVRVRRRETEKVAPLYAPNSPQAMFHDKVTAKGHRMSKLERVSNSPNWTARCETCGMEGDLVIQYEDNFANQTYEIARGTAIERTCPSSKT
jgi:hypothetical protein